MCCVSCFFSLLSFSFVFSFFSVLTVLFCVCFTEKGRRNAAEKEEIICISDDDSSMKDINEDNNNNSLIEDAQMDDVQFIKEEKKKEVIVIDDNNNNNNNETIGNRNMDPELEIMHVDQRRAVLSRNIRQEREKMVALYNSRKKSSNYQ